MIHHLYSDFLESEESYRQSEHFWRSLVDEVAAQKGQYAEWRPWQAKTFLNGTPVPRDGNPIFNARSNQLARAVRIIQNPPESDTLEVAAWIDTFDFSEARGPGFTEELIVNLALSEESAAIVRVLLEKWMDRSVSRERMEDIIADLETIC
jgi:hypothetical protein